ncbi:hypothetical protein B2G71_19110 [Novosphingobium sp. PC22D]|uniref:hypothetical protein n=1 Tax=Novosphingobium sp. PC22D TaxID=1962403 RepID=UPI000BF067E2|nr:hypothetical protein [Novosphingobium sp. PC22D]PEQ11147.1 hypothetical protein B2G71_19110 [Novosphingobium sp. PC22D]
MPEFDDRLAKVAACLALAMALLCLSGCKITNNRQIEVAFPVEERRQGVAIDQDQQGSHTIVIERTMTAPEIVIIDRQAARAVDRCGLDRVMAAIRENLQSKDRLMRAVERLDCDNVRFFEDAPEGRASFEPHLHILQGADLMLEVHGTAHVRYERMAVGPISEPRACTACPPAEPETFPPAEPPPDVSVTTFLVKTIPPLVLGGSAAYILLGTGLIPPPASLAASGASPSGPSERFEPSRNGGRKIGSEARGDDPRIRVRSNTWSSG